MRILILLSLVAFAWGQNLCKCGMFASTSFAEVLVHELPPYELNDCDNSGGDCALFCIAEWEFIFSNGGLNFIPPASSDSLGQGSCTNINEVYGVANLDPTPVHNNYRVCEGPWIWDGETSRGALCCVDGIFPGDCRN